MNSIIVLLLTYGQGPFWQSFYTCPHNCDSSVPISSHMHKPAPKFLAQSFLKWSVCSTPTRRGAKRKYVFPNSHVELDIFILNKLKSGFYMDIDIYEHLSIFAIG